MEIETQASFRPRGFVQRTVTGEVDFSEGFDTKARYHMAAFDQHRDFDTPWKRLVPVGEFDRKCELDFNSSPTQFEGEAGFVGALEKTWTKFLADFDGGEDDFSGELVEIGGCGFGNGLRRIRRRKIDATFDPVSQQQGVEVHQQANGHAGKPEVAQYLGFVKGVKRFHRLDLDNNRPFRDEIHAISAVKFRAAVNERKRHLPSMDDSEFRKLDAQGKLIVNFIKPRPQFPMN